MVRRSLVQPSLPPLVRGNTDVDLIMEWLVDLGLTCCNFWAPMPLSTTTVPVAVAVATAVSFLRAVLRLRESRMNT